MQRFIAALMAAASCAGIAHAQTAPLSGVPTAAPAGGDVVTLESALAQGGAASPSIEASTAGVRAATAARSVAGLRPNPEIQATTENVAGTGVYKGLRSSETTVGVALPLELGGKRSARVALANARLTRAEIQSAIAIADLRLRITQLYVEAAAALKADSACMKLLPL